MNKNLIAAKDISIIFDGKSVLSQVSFSINKGDKLGIVGQNGSGKSSLLKVIVGELKPDYGTLSAQRGLLIKYVPQSIPEEYQCLTVQETLEKTLATQSSIPEWKAYVALEDLGFKEEQIYLPLRELSAGEQVMVLICLSLILEPDIILLDEPSNYLTHQQKMRLSDILLKCSSAVVLVSHDRSLLDMATQKTFVLKDGQLFSFPYSFKRAWQEVAHIGESQRINYAQESREIERLKESTRRLQVWASNNDKFSGRYTSMSKRLKTAEECRSTLFSIDSRAISALATTVDSDFLVRIENIIIEQNGEPCLCIEELLVAPGDKVALLGNDDKLKNLLLECLIKDTLSQVQGVYYSPQAVVQLYDCSRLNQVSSDLKTYLLDSLVISDEEITSRLVRAGFAYEVQRIPVKNLSGGEKARLEFLRISLINPNLWVMKHPNANLDIVGIEQLERSIKDSSGTFIFSSDDKNFEVVPIRVTLS